MTKKLAMLFVIVFALISVCIPTLACEECGNYYMVTTGNVNVRANPDINAKVIGWVSEGEYVEPLNFICTYDGRTWVQVDWDGRDGYISDKYLTQLHYVAGFGTKQPDGLDVADKSFLS